MKHVKFNCHGNSSPAYSCNLPGDQSGEYVKISEVGYLREDDDGHKYVIPGNSIKRFDNLSEYLDGWTYDEWENVNQGIANPFDCFEEDFGKYRVEGNLSEMKIIMSK